MSNRNSKKKKGNKDGTIEERLVKEVEEKRYTEADEVLEVLKNYPGSTCEELMMLSGFCGNCFSRRMAWLKVNGLIEFDGKYYWALNKE